MPGLTESEESELEEEDTSGGICSGVFSLGRFVDALRVDDSCLEPIGEVGEGVGFLSGMVRAPTLNAYVDELVE